MSDTNAPATAGSETPAPITPVTGLIILLLVIVMIAGWIALGGIVFGITSFYASFLFLWYWAAVEQADFKQWLPTVLGGLFGLALAWQSVWLPTQIPGAGGLALGIIILLAAVYVQIMNWVPMVINRAAMLFLTVLAAPAILQGLDVKEVAMAIVLGAVFIGAAVKLATMAAAKMGNG